MYDGAVAAAIEMFEFNPPVSSIPNTFPRYVVRALSRGMLRSYFTREENSRIRPGWGCQGRSHSQDGCP